MLKMDNSRSRQSGGGAGELIDNKKRYVLKYRKVNVKC